MFNPSAHLRSPSAESTDRSDSPDSRHQSAQILVTSTGLRFNPIYRSLYWRIAVGFILCVAGVLAVQGIVLLWLLDRTTTAAVELNEAVSRELGRTLEADPAVDLDRYAHDRFPRPSRSFYAVMTDGQVISVGDKRPNARVIEAVLAEYRRSDLTSIPESWRTEPYHSAVIRVHGKIVGAVAVVPETWVEQLGSTMVVMGVCLLGAGTAVASLFIFGPAHRRLKELETTVVQLGAGHLTARARDDGGDEVAALARAFNRMADDLAASDRTRRLLLADVSHELMTPLTAVRGYQEKLSTDPAIRESDERQRYVTIIGDETRRVEHIVGDLLDLARLESGGDSLDVQDVSVEGLFGRVAARHAPHAADKQVVFSTSIEPGAELVYGDGFRLEQALQNLAANALRHTPPGGHIELRADLSDNGPVLSIRDTGEGIPAQHLPFVFDRFYKIDSSRPGHAGGSGLGLSIVKAIIERHGGIVTVSSELHAGSVFTIRLPAAMQGPP